MNDQTNEAQRSRATKLKVELLQDHEHEGRPCKPGEQIDVDDGAGRWLIELGKARAVTPNKRTTKQED